MVTSTIKTRNWFWPAVAKPNQNELKNVAREGKKLTTILILYRVKNYQLFYLYGKHEYYLGEYRQTNLFGFYLIFSLLQLSYRGTKMKKVPVENFIRN